MATSDLDEAWLRSAIDPRRATIVRADHVDAARARLAAGTRLVAIGDPASPAAPVSDVDHVITRAWSTDALNAIVDALSSGRPQPPQQQPPPRTPDEAALAQRAVAAARRLATATDLATCEAIAGAVLEELLELDRAHCLYHDPDAGSLWSEARLSGPGGDDRRAVAGLAGFAARTGEPALTPQAGRDPRFRAAIDDPGGDPSDQLVAQPVHGGDGRVHAVLVGVRRAHRPPFEPHELALLERLAGLATPILEQLAVDQQARAILDEVAHDGLLFRGEAVQAQLQPRWGDVVRVSPAWLPWASRALAAALAASAALAALGTVSTYSAGPAVIRSLARSPLFAHAAGAIVSVEVMPGFPVEAGAVIARLDDTDQREAVARLERDFETQLRNHMADPSDATADALLRDARDELAVARAALGERLIRATAAGVVGDVRVRAGLRVERGDVVATVLDARRGLEVVALLPGEDRPRLAPGMVLRLELAGYRYAYQDVAIESVASDVVSPAEARRILGAEAADGIPLGGPVALVRGRLPAAEFAFDDRVLGYHDGMRGIAEVRVSEEPLLVSLIPGMRRLW